MTRWHTFALAGLMVLCAPDSSRAQSSPPQLSAEQIREASEAIQGMKRAPKGPYERIRWFCVDGTVQPPQSGACSARGGGVQHAQHSAASRRLAELGFHVGTILQATPKERLLDARADGWRLKELALERYLVEIDDGWVLRQARYYRGARQIEDEEARGREFLEWALSDTAWTARNYLLASRAVAVVPHPIVGTERRTDRIRNLATELAVLDEKFQPLRGKIHSVPSREDLTTVEARLASGRHAPEVRSRLEELRRLLREQYDPGETIRLLGAYQGRIGAPFADDLEEIEGSLRSGRGEEALNRIADLSVQLRRHVIQSTDGRANLVRMDVGQFLQEVAFVLSQDRAASRAGETRAARIEKLERQFSLAYGAGLLSWRERGALLERAARLRRDTALTALRYRSDLAYLARSLEWGYGTARGVFGPVEQHYGKVEPKAIGFLDALVRGSNLLPLSQDLDHLAADADAILGASHSLFGAEVGHGVRGLNPGVAMRPMHLVSGSYHPEELDASSIYVLPETTAELRPVAGVLTLDAGNLLSHVQLLARNLGIPNAVVSSEYLPLLEPARGSEVFYAVSPLGRVVLARPQELTPDLRGLVAERTENQGRKYKLDTSRLRLGQTDPIPLEELRAKDSGIRVGPKAANLGQLAAYFPGRVSTGVALPFGLFHRHVDRPFDSEKTVLDALRHAYRSADSMRAAGASEAQIDRFMFERLAHTRRAILELEWQPETERAILDAIQAAFGPDVSQGVFVRSDTNVEDLPHFSGAGLNLTVPHVTSREGILSAIRRVWTSPFSERAYLWRKQILQEQGDIYPSVLLLSSVHSEKSGVLITSGLQAGGPNDLTIVTGEGVGGGVEGEDAETIIVSPSGAITLLTQAKAPFRRTLLDTGGAALVSAARPDVLLKPQEIRQLQDVVAEWKERFARGDKETVWDIEFGFVEGRLWLFQIRPFVRFRSGAMMDRLAVLDAAAMSNAGRRVDLREVM